MKTIILLVNFFLVIFCVGVVKADPYTEAMKKNIAQMDSAKSMTDYQNLANQFERIATVENSKWEPLYYTAMCYIFVSYTDQNKENADSYLDKAQLFIDKAIKLNNNESEIVVLQAWLHQARIQVNPMSRGQKFSELANTEFEKAKSINPENPRIYYLIGMNVFYTPKFFGGGAKNAKPHFETAKQKYESFKPATEISPNWGANGNNKMLAECEK